MKELSWKQVKEKISKQTVAVVPVGSVEQHGLHAPLGTDLIIAEAFATVADEHKDTLVLPPVPVGVAEYHRHFAGTMWVSTETLKQYVGDIINSLAFHGIEKIILVNGHGGNREPLKELARYKKMEDNLQVVVWTWFESIEKKIINMYGERPPLHADEAESSMLMTVAPELILKENLEDSSRGAAEQWCKFHNGTLISQEVRDFSESGATGDPVKIDAEKGKQMYDLSKENLWDLIDYMGI